MASKAKKISVFPICVLALLLTVAVGHASKSADVTRVETSRVHPHPHEEPFVGNFHKTRKIIAEKWRRKHNSQKADTHDTKATTVCTAPACITAAAHLIEAMDETADPCEDFFQFACGGWYDSHPVTNVSEGTFYAADNKITDDLHEIFTSSASPSDPPPVWDIRTHYSTCLDTDTMDSLGIDPLWTQLSAVGQGGWPLVMDTWDDTKFTIEQALVHVEKIEVYPVIALGISADFLNTSYNILYLIEGALGLPSDYLLNPLLHEQHITAYKKYISDSAKLIRDGIGSSVTDQAIDAEVDTIVDFEIALANTMQFLPGDMEDILEKQDIAYLQNITDAGTPGQFDWLTYFRVLFSETSVFIDSSEPLYIAGEPFFTALSDLLASTNERTLANYIGWWWVMATGDATTYAMRNVTLQFLNSLYGTTSLYSSRDDHCLEQTQLDLAMPTSRAYIDGYFDTATKPEVAQLIEQIRSAYSTILTQKTWMTPGDIADSEEKLAAIVDRVAYPDWIMNDDDLTVAFSGLNIIAGQQYNNLMRIAEFFNFWTLEIFRQEPHTGWILPPTIVNAFYDVFSNSITILAGILQPPFYTQNSVASVNYGGIGVVIGHEFTHGFDNTGRRFDKDGNLASWWDQSSIDNFNDRAQCFVDQYDQYSPPELDGTPSDNMTVNGQQTLGENIADNGGIHEAYLAYSNYVAQFGDEPLLPGLENYTAYQLFFLGFANVWCEHRTYDALVSQLESDPHSPGRFRVIGTLSNDVDFRNIWNCAAGTDMNRGNDSCVIW